MQSLTEQLAAYRQQHTQKTTKITHYIGIPAIVFSLMMLFAWISIDIATKWKIEFSWIFLVATLLYYLALSIRLTVAATIIMIPMTALAIWIARPAPTPLGSTVFLILFFGGWILQFIGHFYEKKRPAFLVSLSQLMVGPLFVLVEGLQALGIARLFIRMEKPAEINLD